MTIGTRTSPPVLEISGLVETGSMARDELADLPGVVDDIGIIVEGFSGQAVPLASVLAEFGLDPRADHCTIISDDGHYTASVPVTDVTGGGWLIFGDGDQPLPREDGGPFRVVIDGGRTLCWNVKSVVRIDLTEGSRPDSVPADPSH